ncbi:hypothetical protein [Alsobacter sp. R-9]
MAAFLDQDKATEIAIRSQLGRVLASPDFGRSERLSKFLRFIVEETLAGRADRLKAYTIALAVFDRPASFDPQADPLVRIEATRLRRALEHYYLTEGTSDPLIIAVPKGAYVPHIAPRQNEPDEAPLPLKPQPQAVGGGPADVSSHGFRPVRAGIPALIALAGLAVMLVGGVILRAGWANGADVAAQQSPALAVLTFRSANSDEFGQKIADGLDEYLIDELAKLGEVRVLGRSTSQLVHQLRETGAGAESLNVRYLLEGSVMTEEGRATVGVRLVAFDQRSVVWSARIPLALPQDVGTAQEQVATAVARVLAQPYGTLYRMEAARARSMPATTAEAVNCQLRYYQYRTAMSADGHRSVMGCLEEVVGRSPGQATARAMLAMVQLDKIRFGLNASEPYVAIVSKASAAAEEAVALEPDNIRALQAAMLARFFAGDIQGGRAAGDRALDINPSDSEVLSEYGTRLAQVGDWSRGARMLEAALEQNPPNAGLLRGHAAFATLMEGQPDKAAAHLLKMNLEPYPSVLFVRMLVSAETGDMRAARDAMASLKQRAPAFITDLNKQTGIRNIPAPDLERIKEIVQRVSSTALANHVQTR